MRESEAITIWRVLEAAYPAAPVGRHTPQTYVQLLMKLPEPHRAMDAVEIVLEEDSGQHRPSIPKFGTIREAYFGETLRTKYTRREIDDELTGADVDSEEWRQENLRRLRLIQEPGGTARLLLEFRAAGMIELTLEEVADAERRVARGETVILRDMP